jgi:large subunit ribosomal protein L18e
MRGTTNEHLAQLIVELKKKAIASNQGLWKLLATDLEKPSRQRRVVNLSRINRHTAEGDIIVVPGKVLSDGELNHALTIAAWSFSQKAKHKIIEKKAKAISIHDLMNMNIKGKKVKVIG